MLRWARVCSRPWLLSKRCLREYLIWTRLLALLTTLALASMSATRGAAACAGFASSQPPQFSRHAPRNRIYLDPCLETLPSIPALKPCLEPLPRNPACVLQV